jgi:hypothetical protein
MVALASLSSCIPASSREDYQSGDFRRAVHFCSTGSDVRGNDQCGTTSQQYRGKNL